MDSASFVSSLSQFTTAVHGFYNELVAVAMVLCFAGLLMHVFKAQMALDVRGLFASLVRLGIIAIAIGQLGTWGDMLISGVSSLVAESNGGSGINIMTAYQSAIARVLGSNAAAENVRQGNGTSAPSMPLTEGDTGGGFTTTPISGVTLTDYGYPGDTSGDSNSARGIGAFGFDSQPGSLIPNYSAALSPDMAAKYNVQPGQQFTVTTNTGSYNLVYADVTSSDLTGRVDIYSPSGQLGGNSFSQAVTSFNGGPIVQGQNGGVASMIQNPGGTLGDQIIWAAVLFCSWVAEWLIWIMRILQQLIYLLDLSIGPIFLALAMIPACAGVAQNYFLRLVGVTMWPLGWAVANLVTIGIINFGINTSAAATGAVGTAAANGSAPLAGLAFLLGLALWIIVTTIGAPLFIRTMFGIASGSLGGLMFGTALGAGLATSRVIGGTAASVASGGAGAISAQSAQAMSAMRTPKFANRGFSKREAE